MNRAIVALKFFLASLWLKFFSHFSIFYLKIASLRYFALSSDYLKIWLSWILLWKRISRHWEATTVFFFIITLLSSPLCSSSLSCSSSVKILRFKLFSWSRYRFKLSVLTKYFASFSWFSSFTSSLMRMWRSLNCFCCSFMLIYFWAKTDVSYICSPSPSRPLLKV